MVRISTESSHPDLNALSVFVRIAEVGSISGAARALDMPVSTVSRTLAELEARLGLSLIKRTTRKLSLSESGLRLLESSAPHLRGLEEARAALTHTKLEPEGLLHVTAPAALGRGEFMGFISRFLAHHPRVQVQLAITNQYLDFVARRVDVAIRFGELADSGIVAKRLGVSRRILVAAPDYLARRGVPQAPRDLSRHDCILFGEHTETEWSLERRKQRARVQVRGRVAATSLEAVNEFALLGHGIALLPEPYLLASTPATTLVRVLPAWTSEPIVVHAAYLSRKYIPAKVQAFLTALASWKNSTWTR